MRKLSAEKRSAILSALIEEWSVNSTARMTGTPKVAVRRLLVDVGSSCADYHDLTVRGMKCARIQAGELWSLVGGMEKARKAGAPAHGDAWCSLRLCAGSELVVCYAVGARALMSDVASQITMRPAALTIADLVTMVEREKRLLGGRLTQYLPATG
jgi:hypothetical protein